MIISHVFTDSFPHAQIQCNVIKGCVVTDSKGRKWQNDIYNYLYIYTYCLHRWGFFSVLFFGEHVGIMLVIHSSHSGQLNGGTRFKSTNENGRLSLGWRSSNHYTWKMDAFLGGGFKYLLFSPLPGEMIQFDLYFSNGLKPPTTFLSIH